MIFNKEHCFQYTHEFRTVLCANASISAELCFNAKEEQKQELYSKIMPQRRHLTQNEQQRALGYLLAGQTQRQVATEFKVNQSVIGRLWQLYLDTGDVHRIPGQGRFKLQLTHRTDVCHLWHDVDGSTLPLSLVGTLNRRMVTGSMLKPSGTDFMPRTAG